MPDSVVEGMIETAFDTIKGFDGFLLDGFPRNISQAEDLDKILSKRGEQVTAVVSIMIPDELIRKRIAHRAAIEGRADDASDETINNRIPARALLLQSRIWPAFQAPFPQRSLHGEVRLWKDA